MNGLASPEPSPAALRLVIGSYVLLFLELYLIMLHLDRALDLRWVIWPVTFVSAACFMIALVGLPSPQDQGGRDDR
ncbi:hypothetical protein M9978_12945 [Sphingomonas sp. MG17]|uniref:Uncharacterized protein n=1 Tax=Sphingomonas tagetis TaxID=2949092 RepID=A0A9X2KLZ1_9SPHN|nr:hypothetical protein [Sphingomonas tagetis]MCP3731335.1 hypothetical protein [Sphingomonas tagetis]